jgi:hypothetical protein
MPTSMPGTKVAELSEERSQTLLELERQDWRITHQGMVEYMLKRSSPGSWMSARDGEVL